MLRSCILLIGLVIGSAGQDVPGRFAASPLAGSQVRSSQTWVLELLSQGEQRSSTFSGLVAELRAGDVIVYVEPGICAFGHLPACLLHQMTVVSNTRYLRVIFDAHRKPANAVLVLIGHELQHAVEISRAPEVKTPEAVARLFRRIGFSPHCSIGLPDCYETGAARVVASRIQRELDLFNADNFDSGKDRGGRLHQRR